MITATVWMLLEEVSVPTLWCWDPGDPWAVTIEFVSERVWVMDRQLVMDGLTSPTGDGDVHVCPAGDGEAYITLNVDGWTCTFTTPTAPVWAFLGKTFLITPAGLESIPDSEYNSLLEDA